MSTNIYKPLLIPFAIFAGQSASAQPNTWKVNGPEGGDIPALAFVPTNPPVVYAGGTGGSVFKGMDGGVSWEKTLSGLRTRGILDLLVVPSGVYAAALAGFLRSIDEGATWSSVSGLFSVFALGASQSGDIIYAGRVNGEVCQNDDGGEQWSCVSSSIQQTILTVAVDPGDSDIVFVAGRSGISRSMDGGQSWKTVGQAVPDLGNVCDMTFAAGTPPILYVAARDGVHSSSDSGEVWTELREFGAVCIAVSPSQPYRVYLCGNRVVRFSQDGGQQWERIDIDFNPRVIAFQPDNADIMLAGSFDRGVFRSSDTGQTWTAANSGLVSTLALPVRVASDSTVYADKDQILISRSTDGAESWTDGGDVGVVAFDVHPTQPGVLLAGSRGLSRSTDGGETWAPTGLISGFTQQVVYDRSNPDIAYASLSQEGMVRSTDGGDTWDAINNGLTDLSISRFAIDPFDPAQLYAASGANTTNGGDQWHSFDNDFPEGRASTLAMDPLVPGRIYATLNTGFFKSEDGANSWSEVTTAPGGFPRTVLADPVTPNVVYFGYFGGFSISVDGGDTWTVSIDGLEDADIRALAADPNIPGRIYSGTPGGVYAIDIVDYKLYFAQFGQSGADLFSQLMLFNLDDSRPANLRVLVKDDGGDPLNVSLSGINTTEGVLTRVIPAGGLTLLKTSQQAPLAVGSVTVCSDTPIGGVILFGGSLGVAGVGASPRLTQGFAAPMQVDQSSGTSTGVAIVDLGAGTTLDLTLLDGNGQMQAEATEDLSSLGHLSKFVDQFDWDSPVDFETFQGQLLVHSDQPLTATVIQTRAEEFATMPVAGLGATAMAGQVLSDLLFAQYGNGGEVLFSQFLTLNLDETDEASATLTIRGDDGALLPTVLNGDLTDGELDFSIPAQGLHILTTSGLGPVVSGSARVTSQQDIAGVLLFGGSVGVAGVGASIPTSGGFVAPVETSHAETTDTGIAILNTADQAVTVDFMVRNSDGNNLDTAELILEPGEHRALFLDQIGWQTDFDFGTFLGTLVAVPRSGSVAATVIQTRPDQFATLPVENLGLAQK